MGQAKCFKTYPGFVFIRYGKICRDSNDGQEGRHVYSHFPSSRRTSMSCGATHGSIRDSQEAERAGGGSMGMSLIVTFRGKTR